MKNSPDVKQAIEEAKKRVEEKRSQFASNISIASSKRKTLRS